MYWSDSSRLGEFRALIGHRVHHSLVIDIEARVLVVGLESEMAPLLWTPVLKSFNVSLMLTDTAWNNRSVVFFFDLFDCGWNDVADCLFRFPDVGEWLTLLAVASYALYRSQLQVDFSSLLWDILL